MTTTRTLLTASALLLVLAGCDDGPGPSTAAPEAPAAVAPAGTAAPTTAPTRSAASSTATTTRSTSAVTSWQRVSNARYGFSCEVPTGWTTDGESTNGDGIAYTSPDGSAQERCFGANNLGADVGSTTAAEALADAVRRHRADGDSVTYQDVSGSTVTVSGTTSSRTVFYERIAWGPGATSTLLWTYPSADKAAYDTAKQRTARSFRAGDAG